MELSRVGVVGIGRVGLPLALALREAGFDVFGIDRDEALLAAVAERRMPFREPGFDELLSETGLEAGSSYEPVGTADAVVITVGTPLKAHIETDLAQLRSVLGEILPRLRKGALLVLRSTVAPGTTEYVARLLKSRHGRSVGDDVALAFCPERIAEGRARVELKALPQIVGAEDERSRRLAHLLFAPLGAERLDTDWRGAELAKLFNNISRTVYFAVSNQLAIVAEQFGANIHEVLHLCNHGYPRTIIASPGFTAGTCLRKDFGMINEHAPYPDLLLSAWKVNEAVPRFLVDLALRRRPLHDRTVAVLGYTFKRGADDLRDSLAPKLVRAIEREVPREVRICEPYLGAELPEPQETGGTVRNWPLDECLQGAEVVFVATDHEPFAGLAPPRLGAGTLVIDLWNCTGRGEICYEVGEAEA